MPKKRPQKLPPKISNLPIHLSNSPPHTIHPHTHTHTHTIQRAKPQTGSLYVSFLNVFEPPVIVTVPFWVKQAMASRHRHICRQTIGRHVRPLYLSVSLFVFCAPRVHAKQCVTNQQWVMRFDIHKELVFYIALQGTSYQLISLCIQTSFDNGQSLVG